MLKLYSISIVMLIICSPLSSVADIPPPGGEAIAENCGRFTIAPGGGENLVDANAGNDYRIQVRIWDINGDPVVGLPATDIWVDRPGELSTCPWSFSQADEPTDASGQTSISGTIYGGLAADASGGIDCGTTELYVYVMGIILNDGQPVCVAFDSPDLNGDLAVTVADFGMFISDFNCTSDCDPCHDFNEDGLTTVADFGIFADYFNQSTCP